MPDLGVDKTLQCRLWRSLQHVDGVALPHRTQAACSHLVEALGEGLGSMNLRSAQEKVSTQRYTD